MSLTIHYVCTEHVPDLRIGEQSESPCVACVTLTRAILVRNMQLTRANQLHIRRVLKCDSTQDVYTSLALLLAVAVHKLLVLLI